MIWYDPVRIPVGSISVNQLFKLELNAIILMQKKFLTEFNIHFMMKTVREVGEVSC